MNKDDEAPIVKTFIFLGEDSNTHEYWDKEGGSQWFLCHHGISQKWYALYNNRGRIYMVFYKDTFGIQ